MTEQDLEIIKTFRQHNYSYHFIGEALSMSPNTVKSICRRQHIEANGPRKTKVQKQNTRLCKYCHCLLVGGRKERSFCSDTCRSKWWNENRKVTEIKP